MKLYTAFDLHSNNSYLGIIDESGKRVFKRKLANDPASILDTLKPYKEDIAGIETVWGQTRYPEIVVGPSGGKVLNV